MQAALGVETDEAAVDPARRQELEDAIAYWTDRLAPVLDLCEPLAPSAALWRRIASDTAERAVQPRAVAARSLFDRLWNSLGLWRLATAAVAAMFAVIFLGPQLWRK